MNTTNIIGMIAACCTTLSFLPQAIHIIRTKNTASISLLMYSLFTVGTFMWCLFGVSTQNIPIIMANFITMVFAVIILVYKIKYK